VSFVSLSTSLAFLGIGILIVVMGYRLHRAAHSESKIDISEFIYYLILLNYRNYVFSYAASCFLAAMLFLGLCIKTYLGY